MARWRIASIVLAAGLGMAQAGCAQSADPGTTDGSLVQPAATSGAAQSDRAKPRREGRGPWWLDQAIVTELGVTPEQVEQVRQLMAGRSDEDVEQNKKERRATLQLLRALSKDPYDAAVVERLSAALDDVLAANHRRRIAQVRGLRDILTHAQWLKMWEVAPQAVQLGRFNVLLGPKITVTDGTPVPTASDPFADDAEDAPPAP